MAETTRRDDDLIASLNDLLQLDHDAVEAYGVAIDHLDDQTYADTLRLYRGDHQRHIRDLTQLIRDRGATPVELPHLPSGVFKLALQEVGRAGGDVGILLAFQANERQVRDKYRRMAREFGEPGVSQVLNRNARDEEAHYDWVLRTLDELGYGPDSRAGRVERVVERVHARTADALESAERAAMRVTGGRAGRAVQYVKRNPVRSALIALGAGLAIGGISLTRRR